MSSECALRCVFPVLSCFTLHRQYSAGRLSGFGFSLFRQPFADESHKDLTTVFPFDFLLLRAAVCLINMYAQDGILFLFFRLFLLRDPETPQIIAGALFAYPATVSKQNTLSVRKIRQA